MRALLAILAGLGLPSTPAQRLGLPPVKAGPVPGYVMIADRNNNRIIMVSPAKRIVWQVAGLHDPDDAFFSPGWRQISTNEEFNQTVALIGVRSRRVEWSYGHAGVRGSGPGYLANPDDAYLLRNGLIQVADIENCRVVWIDRRDRIVRGIGHAGSCGHDPPRSLSSPNGDTPLPDGGVLVTEIGGWVDRISAGGRLVYSVRTPTTYPSDAQLLPNGNILVAGFNDPGRVDEITPSGTIVWSYRPTGYWALNRPSLAVRWPNGMIAITDDWNHRVVVVDPGTKQVVWSYGHLGRPGAAPGYLNKPDGLDLLPGVPGKDPGPPQSAKHFVGKKPDGLDLLPGVPGKDPGKKPDGPDLLPAVARSDPPAVHPSVVHRIGSLPHALAKAAAIALPDGRMMVLGGETGGASTSDVLLGAPGALHVAGRLPAPTHDAGAALVGASVYLFGGGQATSVDSIVRVDAKTGRAASAGRMDEPLSDLGAVVLGRKAYLVGGYTGARYASAILRYDGGGRTTTVARLPAGTRYAGVAAIGRTIYVAGGLTTAGTSSNVYAVGRSVRKVAALPAPEAHAGMAALGGVLYLVGGREILRIDPHGSVSVAARLPVSLTDPAVVALGGRIVIVGGGTSSVYGFTPR
jgi:outer membrane protein assembly factor BamB